MNTPDPTLTELCRLVDFGDEVKAFKEGRLGAYLWKRADDEIKEAFEGLANVDAENPKAIRELQNQLYRAESFQRWLDEAIETGHGVKQELFDRDLT